MKDKEIENIVNNEFTIANDDQQSSNTVVNEKVEKSTPFTRIKSVLLYVGIIIAMFMVSLNTTVVAPAMSIIATELNALEQQTWVATAYLVVFNAVQPLAGKVISIYIYIYTELLYLYNKNNDNNYINPFPFYF